MTLVKKRKSYGVSAEQFLTAWTASRSVGEFCERTGMSRAAALSRASYYRNRLGLPVKSMPAPGGAGLDKERLRRICLDS